MSVSCDYCEKPVNEPNEQTCKACRCKCRGCDKEFASESSLIQMEDGDRYCKACAVECGNGPNCDDGRYFEPGFMLSRRGLCDSCEEVAPPGAGETCEYHPDRPATSHVDGTPVCDDCHEDAYPVN